MVKIKNLQKKYNKFSLSCSLEIAPGTITGLIGPNGAGKSTLFKAILGLISIDGGNIEVMGKDSRKLDKADKQKIGVVLSEANFSKYLTIKDIIPVLDALYHAFDRQKFLESCERFGLPLDKKIQDFSTGMKAKLKVLVAISHEAKLLILDEPTSGLDIAARESVLNMLREYMERHEDASIIISSHISTDLENLCDDVYLIYDGEIVIHEEMDVLLDEYAILKVDEGQYAAIEKQYLLKVKKEKFGFRCLTNQKRFYRENYPEIVVEDGTLDELIMIMIKGEES